MIVCGVEIKGTEAIVCLLSFNQGLVGIPDCRSRKIDFSKQNRASDLQYFQATFSKLMQDYKVDLVVVKERPQKGKFAGGALGFKMEAAIQLISEVNVELMSASKLKESLKKNPLSINFNETGLKVFQKTAFEVAYATQMNKHYKLD